MIEVLCALVSVLVLLLAIVVRPDHSRCPETWHHGGITRRGVFVCTRTPVGDPNDDGTCGHPERSIVPPGELDGRIYCTGGAVPIVIDQRTVGCQR